ncbi:serine protease [Aspergillus mulundensis]|uniref:Peptidase S1A, chymotrypsin-type n=1 Tax=Aspergillus mulundensis TaxID=1810919 RepID=A0A3D8T2K0_9EURO|nr:Peptidase S1A, chymotrypsin-type [Aspergillus mulundensis]RDW92774.1 Peptidase S1A, chymotrypsin-type [Aspergillus mulundensis]
MANNTPSPNPTLHAVLRPPTSNVPRSTAAGNSDLIKMLHPITLLSALTSTRTTLKPSIVGGTEVSITDYPYQIALLNGGACTCGGSIISPNHIVTAAHCVRSARDPSHISIRAGSSFHNTGGEIVNVSAIAVHPAYSAGMVDNDIAVLTLGQALEFKPGIEPIALPASGSTALAAGEEVVVSGWGTETETGSLSRVLRAVAVAVTTMAECRAAHGEKYITESMFCAGVAGGGKDACYGDSGGPVVGGGVLVGVVSWGKGCARPGYPGVYASAAYLRDFIAAVAGV